MQTPFLFFFFFQHTLELWPVQWHTHTRTHAPEEGGGSMEDPLRLGWRTQDAAGWISTGPFRTTSLSTLHLQVADAPLMTPFIPLPLHYFFSRFMREHRGFDRAINLYFRGFLLNIQSIISVDPCQWKHWSNIKVWVECLQGSRHWGCEAPWNGVSVGQSSRRQAGRVTVEPATGGAHRKRRGVGGGYPCCG